jgi:hypothetical protein
VLLAAVQGLYIASAPSVSVRQSELGGISTLPPGDHSASGVPVIGTAGAGPATASSSGPLGAGAVAGGAAASGTTGATPAPSETGAAAASAATATDDRSHCSPRGRQHDRFHYEDEAPVCVAAWPDGADNGGATYRGVEGDTIKVVVFEEKPNEQVDAILAAQNLAATESDKENTTNYGELFLNKYYELYGRKIDFIRFKSECPISPPDLPKCKQEARKVVEMNPFAVIFGQALYPELFDEWARAGIVAIGGWNFEDSYFTERRPFRYDVFMTGTRSANHVVEYYCKKMANQPADHAGQVIHPTIGSRTTPRRLGIITSENAPLLASARYIAQEIAKCDTANGSYVPEIVTYVGDIDRAAEQQEAVSSKMINSGTTTVMCWCGPLEMTGFARNFTAQQYYPEHLLPGMGLLDVDVIGRLYPSEQWEHAFGPSHVSDPRPFQQEQVNAAFNDAGATNGCVTCSLSFLYLHLVAQGIQFAGPNLNPLTFESGLLSSPGTGGQDRFSARWDWGPGDYGGYADVREVYWDSTATSAFDGNPGGYIVLNEGRRFREGEWSSEMNVPVKPS